MNLVERIKNICITPKTEWPVIDAETTPTAGLITGYVAPLAGFAAVCGFIGGSLVGYSAPFMGHFRVPVISGLSMAIFQFVMAIVAVFVISFIIDALAPSFGGQKNKAQALKVAVYAFTPGWLAAVFNIIPGLGLLALLGSLYGLYLLYLGLPRLMKSPEDKAIGYTAVVVICAIVLSVIIGALVSAVGGIGMMGAGAMGGALSGVTGGPTSRSNVEFDKDSPMGKLDAFGKKMEESNKKMEAAQKSGDKNAQMQASMEALGTALGGGKRVEPLGIDQLKPFVPDTFAGLPKKSSNAEKSGMAGVMISKAEATYGDAGGKQVSLEVSDTGGMSGLMGLAGWVGVQGEKDNDSASERTQKVNGRLMHEKVSKRGGSNEFAVVLGDRFIVTAKGNVDLETLKGAVAGVDLGKLEAMKDVGVQK